MQRSCRICGLVSACALLCMLVAQGQEAPPSLGAAARQARLQKQQKEAQASKDAPAEDASAQSRDARNKNARGKDASGKDLQAKDAASDPGPSKAKRVITNDEIPEHIGPTRTAVGVQKPGTNDPQPSYGDGKAPAEYWKAQIQAAKNYVTSLQNNLNQLNDSIHYAGGNCVSGCVQWNERQQQKQAQAEAMKSQLEEMQRHLEELQEMARRQGYGSSVYDP